MASTTGFAWPQEYQNVYYSLRGWKHGRSNLSVSRIGFILAKVIMTQCDKIVYSGVPLIGIPMFGDQDQNAKKALNQGFLLQLDWSTLTEKDLMAGIQEVLNNNK